MALSAQKLERLGVPPAKARAYAPYLAAAMREARITSKPRAEMFLAQLWHESAALKYFEEIAAGAAYEGRRDLGNTQPGDGRRFKGRGPIQLTGRANYRAAGRALGLDLESRPKLAATPKVGFRVAAWYWTSRSLNQLADRGDFREITRRINGGYNGWNDRVRWLKRMRSLDVRPGDPSLSRGDRGRGVVVLTRRLSFVRSPETGKRYLDGKRDRFDVETVKALKRFQGEHGLEPSGKFGPKTEKALARAVARRKRAVARRKHAVARPKHGGRPRGVEPLPPGRPDEGQTEKPPRRRGSGQLLQELERVESREDRLLDVLLRRGIRLERLVGDAEQRDRVVTLDELRSVREGLVHFESAIDDVQARITRAEAASVPASAAGQTRAPAGGDGGDGDGPGESSSYGGKTATKRASAEGPSAAAGTPGNGSPGGVAPAGSPEGGAPGGSSGTAFVGGGGREPRPPEPGHDGDSSPPSAVGTDPLSLGNSMPVPTPPQSPPGGAPSSGRPTSAQFTFEELAATIREHDAESERLQGAIRDRLLALEEKAGTLHGGKSDPPEPRPPTKPRGAVYRVTSPPMKSPRIRSLQRLLNHRFAKWRVNYRIREDGEYGPATHHAARRVAYGLGVAGGRLANGLTPELRKKIRHPDSRSTRERERARRRGPWIRALRRRHKIPGVKGGIVRPLETDPDPKSEFSVRDAEGAPGRNGSRYHAAKDWFAPGGSKVRAPVSGKIVEVKPSRGNTGQVFGGVVKIQSEDGKVWVFRHVDPRGVRNGERVRAGELVATVTPWRGGPSHAHIEIWKSLSPSYKHWNMIDPMTFFRRFAGTGPSGR
ncbi:MAG TPA: peptidoglycan DD-metalloendopeptidase family protein [Thermoleophilaceae bacterium]|nr:peptidoglycan DD-metalloendopeptidase family protein [Thermoleophilaceae bacterium]